jgi:hypothetical protein
MTASPIISWSWPRRHGTIAASIDDDTALVHGNKVVWVVRTTIALVTTSSIGRILLVRNLQSGGFEAWREGEHVLELAFL